MPQGVVGDVEIMALFPGDFRVQRGKGHTLAAGAFLRQAGRFFFLRLCSRLLRAGWLFAGKGLSGLFHGPFIREIPVNAQPSVFLQVINGSAIIGKAILAIHGAIHILLRSLFRLCKRLVVQLFVKAVFKMMVHGHLIRRFHAPGVTVDVLRGDPFRFIWKRGIQFPHFSDLFPHVSGPQVLFCPSSSAQKVVAVGF